MEGTQDCTIYRSAVGQAVTAAGGYVDVWGAAQASNVPCFIERISVGRAIKLFGVDSNARYTGHVDKGVDIKKEDVVKIVAGELSGTYVRVLEVDPIIDSDYVMLEMADTDEVPD